MGLLCQMVGNGVAGRGGTITLGSVGRVGFGKEAIWVLGNGGNVVLNKVGNGVLSIGGKVAEMEL